MLSWILCIAMSTTNVYALACIADDALSGADAYPRALTPTQIRRVAFNVYVWLQMSVLACFLAFPPPTLAHDLATEASHVVANLTFGDLWFYAWHRLLHHPRLFATLHATHHEAAHPVGMHALHAHPFDAVVVNLGSAFFLHIFVFRFSVLQAFLVGTFATLNTVLSGHTARLPLGDHQVHHRNYKCNFGFLITDYVFGTF